MKFYFDTAATQNLDQALDREWIDANGLGGWASSTIIGLNTRRYHGLLVAATKPPVGRMVMLSKLDEALTIGKDYHDLSTNAYPGLRATDGYQNIVSFTRELFPVTEYRVGPVRLRKTVAAVHGYNTTVITYELLAAPHPVELELKPLVAAREFHNLVRANDAINARPQFQDGLFQVQPYLGVPRLYIRVPGAAYRYESCWYANFEYCQERARGLDFREDLFCYGAFVVKLAPGARIGVIVSTEDPIGQDATELLALEEQRRRKIVDASPVDDDFFKTLLLAGDQFIVARRRALKTIIAGYHWFSDWGRDTMIALPGLCLSAGRMDDARTILQAYAQYVSQGMLPNTFPDVGEEPAYNTVDATLWYFVAIYRYLGQAGDARLVEELYPVLKDIVAWHERGTRYGIKVDADGLLAAGEAGCQLTWMDAKVGDWVVTPRQGKAVEINALWYNALRIMAELAGRFGAPEEAVDFARKADRVQARFPEVFWNPDRECLYDVVDGARADPAIRPNQLLAISLPFTLLSAAQAEKVLNVVEEKLVTPVGLRSLAPGEKDYHPVYDGDALQRDGAYHQGTVWSWLIGPYVMAVFRLKGREEARRRAAPMLERIKEHLAQGGIGTISEIFDATPPYEPKGCIAQAWSVGEILRVCREVLLGGAPPPPAAPPVPPEAGPAA